MTEVTYPVHERFYTFQGEGHFSGQPAFFIRMFGCPVKCPWCDSAGTWHPDYIPRHIARLSVDQLVEEVKQSGSPLVVLTGGEPAIHDLNPLVSHLVTDARVVVSLETSGAFRIRADALEWVTLSPKRWAMPLVASIARANEFKFIIESQEDISYYTSLIDCVRKVSGIWLHPEWSKRNDPAVLGAIVDAVKRGRGKYRAGWQIHKLYQADYLDARAASPAPLGGDPSKGY